MERLFICMSFFMSFQLLCRCKFLVALWTVERLFTCVFHFVKGLLICTCSLMFLQITCLCEFMLTLETTEWIFICVYSLMLFCNIVKSWIALPASQYYHSHSNNDTSRFSSTSKGCCYQGFQKRIYEPKEQYYEQHF